MKVVVSSPGRFHAFRLAEQLHKHDCLYYLFTQDFKRRTDKLPRNKIKGSFKLKMLRFIEIASLFIPPLKGVKKRLDEYKRRKHDEMVADFIRNNPDFDIFVSWFGRNPLAVKEAKRNNIVTISDCGVSHPEYRREILNEEYYNIFGKDFAGGGKKQKKAIKRKKNEIDK